MFTITIGQFAQLTQVLHGLGAIQNIEATLAASPRHGVDPQKRLDAVLVCLQDSAQELSDILDAFRASESYLQAVTPRPTGDFRLTIDGVPQPSQFEQEDEPIEEEEPEENERDYNGERITLEEECAACGTELHHSRGEFGNDGDDIEVPYWRFVYDPVCDEMQVDSGSMVCRECLENGSDFEHTVDCFSDDEDPPGDFDQSRESQRAYMESRQRP